MPATSAPRQGPEHDHGGEVDARGDAEDARADRLANPRALRLLEQLGREGGGAEQRERRQRAPDGSQRSGHGHAETGRHGCVGEEGMPHGACIGFGAGEA